MIDFTFHQHRAQECQGRRVFLRRAFTLDALSTLLKWEVTASSHGRSGK
jgi:hypothetical protein